jgi:hypothetical protein
MSELSDQQASALEQLRAPSGDDVMERVKAERLGPPAHPHLRAVGDPTVEELTATVAGLRNELERERMAREQAEETAGQMASLIAAEHQRNAAIEAELKAAREHATAAEDELKLAWAQFRMAERYENEPFSPTLRDRMRGALRR